MKNLIICIPVAKTSVDKEFFESYVVMKNYLLSNAKKLPFKLGYIHEYFAHTFPIDANRNECVSKTLEKNGIQHDISIWLDTDQSFQADCLFNLLKHPYPVVAGMYFAKADPYHPIVYNYSKGNKRLFDALVEYPRDKLFEVDLVGMGCVKIDREVLEAIEWPYFKYQNHPIGSSAKDAQWRIDNRIDDVSEDVWFWGKVKDAGFQIVVDPEIQCGHIMRIESNQELYTNYLRGSKETYKEINGEEKFNKLWEGQCRARLLS